MLNQRGIRKSALLLLYAMEAQRVTPESQETFPFDAYWTLVSENDNKRYARALAKAVLHEIRAYDELLTLLQARTTAFCAACLSTLRVINAIWIIYIFAVCTCLKWKLLIPSPALTIHP